MLYVLSLVSQLERKKLEKKNPSGTMLEKDKCLSGDAAACQFSYLVGEWGGAHIPGDIFSQGRQLCGLAGAPPL